VNGEFGSNLNKQHKPYEGTEKEYEPIGKGSFDLKMLADKLIGNTKVDLQEIDLRAPK